MISSTPAVAWAESMVLGVKLLTWSSVIVFEFSNWLAVGVDGRSNISFSPWLVVPLISAQKLQF